MVHCNHHDTLSEGELRVDVSNDKQIVDTIYVMIRPAMRANAMKRSIEETSQGCLEGGSVSI